MEVFFNCDKRKLGYAVSARRKRNLVAHLFIV
jgi:hypothetical protein